MENITEIKALRSARDKEINDLSEKISAVRRRYKPQIDALKREIPRKAAKKPEYAQESLSAPVRRCKSCNGEMLKATILNLQKTLARSDEILDELYPADAPHAGKYKYSVRPGLKRMMREHCCHCCKKDSSRHSVQCYLAENFKGTR